MSICCAEVINDVVDRTCDGCGGAIGQCIQIVRANCLYNLLDKSFFDALVFFEEADAFLVLFT